LVLSGLLPLALLGLLGLLGSLASGFFSKNCLDFLFLQSLDMKKAEIWLAGRTEVSTELFARQPLLDWTSENQGRPLWL